MKEIVFEIVTLETKWTTPHAFYPDMFDEDGKRIPRKPKEERIKEFYGDLEKHHPEIDQEHAGGPAAWALRMPAASSWSAASMSIIMAIRMSLANRIPAMSASSIFKARLTTKGFSAMI